MASSSRWQSWYGWGLVALVALWAPAVNAATATISPINIEDNTLAADFPDNSSGGCDSIFAGTTDNDFARRALMRFAVDAQIPPGSTINSVTLSMAVTRGSNHADSTFSLHRMTTPWGEGSNGCGVRGGGQGEPATSGAATWNDAEAGITPWVSAGGDYDASASGSTLINSTTPVWSGKAAARRRCWSTSPPSARSRPVAHPPAIAR